MDGTCPDPTTPRREGAAPSGPESPRDRTEGATENAKEEKAFSEKQSVAFPDADVVVTSTRGTFAARGDNPIEAGPPTLSRSS